MAAPAERMKVMRERRRRHGLRELRLVVLDSRLPSVRRRVAAQVARLAPRSEEDALRWIEAVCELDEPDRRARVRRGDVVIVAATGDYGKPRAVGHHGREWRAQCEL